jgi:alpha-ketoglutarate-dependent taurine dioxygenase
MTDRIVGLDKAESDVILNYLYDVYEKNVDIQVRFKWTAGTSALWDNRYVSTLLLQHHLTSAESRFTMHPGTTKGTSLGMARG